MLLLLALAAAAPRARAIATPADLIVTGGRIYTVDDTRPIVEAFAVSKGHFVFVGTSRDAMLFKGPSTRVLDVHGATVYPGFIDAHAHMLGLGLALSSVDLVGAPSYEEVVSRVAARAKTMPAGQWITGNGWDQNRWTVKEFPTNAALYARGTRPSSGARPRGRSRAARECSSDARGRHHEGHAGSGRRAHHPRRQRHAHGRVRRQRAGAHSARASGLTPKQLSDAIHAAAVECNKWGLTEVQDMGSGRATIEAFESLARAGRLPLRSYNMVTDDKADLDYYFARGPRKALYDGHVWVRGIKLYADGALGSRGAALLAPYSDDSGERRPACVDRTASQSNGRSRRSSTGSR